MKFSYVNPTLIQFGQQQIAALSDLIAKDQKVLVVLPINHQKDNINKLKLIVEMFNNQLYTNWNILFLINNHSLV